MKYGEMKRCLRKRKQGVLRSKTRNLEKYKLRKELSRTKVHQGPR